MFSFETQAAHTYLTYRIQPGDTLDTLSLGMLMNNRIKGVAPIVFTQMDESKYLKYNISAKVPLSKFFTHAVLKTRMLKVFSGIAESVLTVEDYMIEPSMFVLDPEMIFVDVTTCETLLICLPVTGSEGRMADLSAFFKNIVFSAQYDQTENNDYIAKIINTLNGMETFSLNMFLSVIKELTQTSANETPPAVLPPRPAVPERGTQIAARQAVPMAPLAAPHAPAPPPAIQTPVPSPETTETSVPKVTMLQLLMHYDKEHKEAYRAYKQAKAAPTEKTAHFSIPGVEPAMPAAEAAAAASIPPEPEREPAHTQQQPMPIVASQTEAQFAAMFCPVGFGETTVLGNAAVGETTVLSERSAPAAIPHLIRMKNNEKIMISKPMFRIGKEKSFADYFICDNPAISRSHAEFSSRDGEYYVMDMNSTNHTFVNGSMIQSSVEVKIAHGAGIKLGNEEFEFRLY